MRLADVLSNCVACRTTSTVLGGRLEGGRRFRVNYGADALLFKRPPWRRRRSDDNDRLVAVRARRPLKFTAVRFRDLRFIGDHVRTVLEHPR